jgi:ABC-type phosphate/phosphonate transport system substrate-binding protein
MISRSTLRPSRRKPFQPIFALAILLVLFCAPARGQPAKIDILRIGSTGSLTGNADSPREKAGTETLRSFIKDETGMKNEVLPKKNWQDLAGNLAKGEVHLGVFAGYEFAWLKEKNADLKPLALGVNGYRYPSAHLMAKSDSPARDFAGLQGQSLALPVTNQSFLRLFLERRSEAAGKKVESFFSQIVSPDTVEDALDDVVDGKVQVTAVDQAAYEAYKRRKPGRFKQLKEVVRSERFPPIVVAYYGSTLDADTLRRFKDGLLGAAGKPKGETLLTLSHLTGFEAVPDDFARMLAATRKAYPPPGEK